MATGGLFGAHKIRQFNGHLFEDATVFDLNDDERRILADASEADWQYVEPSIMREAPLNRRDRRAQRGQAATERRRH
jgi:hypothetical protein